MTDQYGTANSGKTFVPPDYGWGRSSSMDDDAEYDNNFGANDADDHDGLHGDANRRLNIGKNRFVQKALRFIQRRSDLEKGIGLVVIILLIVLVVHHRTGPDHALSKEERDHRFLARNMLSSGKVPSDEAYVTIITSDTEAIGAFSLSAALIHVESTRMLRVLATTEVSLSVRNQLSNLPNVASVSVINTLSHDRKIFKDIGSPEWRARFAKLHVWQLSNVNRVIYLDPIAVVLRNLDFLFQYHTTETKMFSGYVTDPQFICKESGGDVAGIDTSIMVLTPSRRFYGLLVDKLTEMLNKIQSPSFNAADVIAKTFEDNGLWMSLSRPGYGFSAHEICQCNNPDLQNNARVLRDVILQDKTVGPKKKEDSQDPTKTPEYGECMAQYHDQWTRYYKQAKRYLM